MRPFFLLVSSALARAIPVSGTIKTRHRQGLRRRNPKAIRDPSRPADLRAIRGRLEEPGRLDERLPDTGSRCGGWRRDTCAGDGAKRRRFPRRHRSEPSHGGFDGDQDRRHGNS